MCRSVTKGRRASLGTANLLSPHQKHSIDDTANSFQRRGELVTEITPWRLVKIGSCSYQERNNINEDIYSITHHRQYHSSYKRLQDERRQFLLRLRSFHKRL
jgi:hypothetical protein